MTIDLSRMPGRSQHFGHMDSVSPHNLKVDFRSNPRMDYYTTTRQPISPLSMPPISSKSFSSTITQEPDSKSLSRLTQWTSAWITDWWGIEIVCWLTAVLSLVAIVIILEIHKDEPLPDWPFDITLNSVISIFATIGQMAMMQPVVECINQLKWLWFIKKQKLAGFQVFDDASRGPTGSLTLLRKFRGMHLVSLGAAITIVSAAFGPFAQMVVRYPLRPYPIGNATAQQVFNYTGAGDADNNPSIAMVASVYQGFTSSNISLSTVSPFCSTGNCTWPEYQSLGVCTNVTDLSSTIITNECNVTSLDGIFEAANLTNPGYPCYNYALPGDGLGFTNVVLSLSLTNADPNEPNPAFAPLQTLALYVAAPRYTSSLGSVYLIYQPDLSTSINSSLPSPIAYELTLDMCVQTYYTTVSNGLTDTQMVSQQLILPNIDELSASQELIIGVANDTYISVEGNTFGIQNTSLLLLNSIMVDLFVNQCFLLPEDSSAFGEVGNETTYCDNPLGNPFLTAMESVNPTLAIEKSWGDVAVSLTNAFRTGGGGETQVEYFQGTAFGPVVFVDTQYLWLILPISLVTFTLVFLLATISKTQRLGRRVWKSSILATMQGLHIDLHANLGGLSSISEMEGKAKETEVRFDMIGGKAEHGVEYRLVESKQDKNWGL